jgi:hypothetical protein
VVVAQLQLEPPLAFVELVVEQHPFVDYLEQRFLLLPSLEEPGAFQLD